MGAMSMPKITLPSINQLQEDFPSIHLEEAKEFYFSARDKCVYYNKKQVLTEVGMFQLIHEIGHALSNHHHFESGVELLKMETEAWSKAEKIAKQYDLEIPPALIERCLDSYRDWLHLRSICPECKATGVETDVNLYHCFNCLQKWSVPTDQRTRRYRHKIVCSV